MWYVYVLQSLKDKKNYTGSTNDLKRRLKEHNSGIVESTKSRVPFYLVGYKEYKSQNEARFEEYQFKKHSDKKKKFIRELETEYAKNNK